MKYLLLFAFCTTFLKDLHAQVPTAMPPEATAFYSRAMPVIRQQVKDFVLRAGSSIKQRKVNSDSLLQYLRGNKMLKGMGDNDIEGIMVLIMVQASNDVDADLKLMVLGIARRKEQIEEQRAPTQPASLKNSENKNSQVEEINNLQNFKLQMMIDRKRSLAEETSNVMESISGMQEKIIADLK